ncbi:MAG: hypothetical protein K6D59_09885 [Bacteroidales bacterium]|nr:hypothetical protein [Bacteroidales bacterium]
MKIKNILFVFCFFYCVLIQAQGKCVEGIVLFYFNSHPSDLITDEPFYSLDSVRLFSSEGKYAVWADYSQEEHFAYDTSLHNIGYGKLFRIWDSVPQFCTMKSRNNYEHIGGDTYYDNNNEIVIAFNIKGVVYMTNKDNLIITAPKNAAILTSEIPESDSTEVVQTVWYDFSTQNHEEYILFIQINNTKSLKTKQYRKIGLKRKRIKGFKLYGS